MADRWEINRAIRLLEDRGFAVRRPSEVDAECRVEIVPCAYDKFGHIGVRVDVDWNGAPYVLANNFPFELLCNPDDDDFRNHDAPQMLARELGAYFGERLLPQISSQIKSKIKPFIPAKPIALSDIQGFIEMALDDRFTEEDLRERFPMFYVEGAIDGKG